MKELIWDAYCVADAAHQGQFRKHGFLPYITHPMAVASMLVKYKQAPEVIAAGLLHDTVEDCNRTLEGIKTRFGSEVAFLVDGVTKEATKEATLVKLVSYAKQDPRVLLIKLCDVAHNCTELNGLTPDAQARFAQYAVGFYAPLARMLGFPDLAEMIISSCGVQHAPFLDAYISENQLLGFAQAMGVE